MILYVDSSAFVRRYLRDEPDHLGCVERMAAHARWATSRLTVVEVHRALELAASRADAAIVRAAFDADLARVSLVEADIATCAIAIDVAVRTGARSLDALQLACALRVQGPELRLLTYDARQARAATELGIRLA